MKLTSCSLHTDHSLPCVFWTGVLWSVSRWDPRNIGHQVIF